MSKRVQSNMPLQQAIQPQLTSKPRSQNRVCLTHRHMKRGSVGLKEGEAGVVSVELANIESYFNWGCGDLGDLKQLIADLSADEGASLELKLWAKVNSNTAQTDNPQNLALNLIYLDVCALSDFVFSEQAQMLVGSRDFQQKIKALRDEPKVDIAMICELKRAILVFVFDDFLNAYRKRNHNRGQAFVAYLNQDCQIKAIDLFSDEELFEFYLQWLIHQQWHEVCRFAKQLNVTLRCELLDAPQMN
ncbi:MAG: hypothetical protein ACPHV3_00550 [Vibrio sp.]